MLTGLATIVVTLFGLYLIALAAVALFRPHKAQSFLLGFAGSARAHYLEMALRVVAGSALVVRGPSMAFGDFFWLFGWVVLVTTAGLLCVPWEWHRRLAQKVVPPAMRHVRWIGLVSLLLGLALLAANTAWNRDKPGAGLWTP